MLPRGRPPGPGTAEEKAAIRREKVRLNVKAYRERKKNNALVATPKESPPSVQSVPRSSSSDQSTDVESVRAVSEEQQAGNAEEKSQVVLRSKHRKDSPSVSVKSETVRTPWNVVWTAPDDGPVFADGFLSTFRNAFLPPRVCLPSEPYGGSMLVTPCSPWIMTAYDIGGQRDNGALKSGLLAIGLILNGLGNKNSNLQVASLQMQRQAICQLRSELEPITLQRQRKHVVTTVTEQYLSCLAVAMFEMIREGFSPAILKHIGALNSLIEFMYADPDTDKTRADLIMEDFGMLEMTFCLKYSCNSVLRKTRLRLGLSQPASAEESRNRKNISVYGDILDIMEELPGLIVQMKAIRMHPYSEKSCSELQQIIRKLIRISGDLDAWNIQFEFRHGSTMVEETFSDERTGQSGVRPRLTTYEHGAVGLYVLNFQLYTIEANIEATSKLARMQQYHSTKPSSVTGSTANQSNSVEYYSMTGGIEMRRYSEPKMVQICNSKGILHEQIKAQRVKARMTMMRLIELISQFSTTANNITAQALLITPCEKVNEVLENEQSRLNVDLRNLAPGDHDGAIKINKILKDLTEAQKRFKSLEAKMKRSDTE